MRHPRLERFLSLLRSEYPTFPVAVLPYQSQDDPIIEHFLHLLDVPVSQLHAVAYRAWDLAFEVYGDDPVPFHLTTIDPESAAKYFAAELVRARASQVQFDVGSQTQLRPRPIFSCTFKFRNSATPHWNTKLLASAGNQPTQVVLGHLGASTDGLGSAWLNAFGIRLLPTAPTTPARSSEAATTTSHDDQRPIAA